MFTTDQSHFRKYLATLGVTIVAGVISLSALALRLPGDLLVKESDLRTLTPVARETIERRQDIVNALMHVLPWFLVFGSSLGVVTSLYGLAGWAGRQRVADDIEDKSRDKLAHEVSLLTADEHREKQELEAAEAVGDVASPGVAEPPLGGPLLRTRHVVALLEAELAAKLSAAFGRDNVLTGVTVQLRGGKATFDALVRREPETYVFELLYSIRHEHLNRRIRELVTRLASAAATADVSRAFAVVVVRGDLPADAALRRKPDRHTAGVTVRTVVLGEEQFLDMPNDMFISLLGLSPS